MRKFLSVILLGLILFCSLPIWADEIEEDYLDIAAGYCISGDYSSAMEYLDKILQINPDNKSVQDLKKGLAHVMSGDKKSYIDGVNPYIKQAQEYKGNGNEQGEYSSLMAGTKAENAYLAYYYLGTFYRNKNDYLRAIDSYNSALSLRPDFAQAYLASGITLFYAGKYEAAINPLDKYLTFVPDDDFAYAIKSRAEFQLGLMEQSQADNTKALSLNDCPEYRFDKAKLLYKSGDFQGAKTLFTELLSDIQTSKIYEYIGYCDYAMENYMSALMNIDKAIILSDDDEFLENKYNEIKGILESKQDAQTQTY